MVITPKTVSNITPEFSRKNSVPKKFIGLITYTNTFIKFKMLEKNDSTDSTRVN